MILHCKGGQRNENSKDVSSENVFIYLNSFLQKTSEKNSSNTIQVFSFFLKV